MPDVAVPAQAARESRSEAPAFAWDRREIAGALGDIGTLVPLAALLIAVNKLNPTVVFGVVGLVYVLSGLYYRIPMAVQPLKSFTSLAIALGLSLPVLVAGTTVMGGLLLLIGLVGAADWIVHVTPKPLVRGIQLGVGIILVKVGGRMAVEPLGSTPIWAPPLIAVGTGIVILLFIENKRFPASLLAVVGGIVVGVGVLGFPAFRFGPAVPQVTIPTGHDFLQATFLLVLPQLPLTLANSVAATCDVANSYYGERARRVTGRALALGLGGANLLAGIAGGMPVCHGSGGLTAHYRFGARTGGAPILLGAVLLAGALLFGRAAAGFCDVLPRAVLGALLVYVGAAHAMLARDTKGFWDWAVVVGTGAVGGITNHNGFGLGAGLVLLAVAWLAKRGRHAS